MYSLPQGVFSETLDYNERAKIRPELFKIDLTLSPPQAFKILKRLNRTDKGAAQLLEVVGRRRC